MISVDLRGHDFRPQVIKLLSSFSFDATMLILSHSWFRFTKAIRVIEKPFCTSLSRSFEP
jgi:hypothetical protein